MKFIASLIAILLPALLLIGCLNGGSQRSSSAYDGSWSISYTDKALVVDSATVSCAETYNPLALSILNGSGNIRITQTCVYTTAAVSGVSPATSTTSSNSYVIGVAMSISGVVNANVNGAPITGQCASPTICSAQGTGNSLGLAKQ